MSRFFAKAAPNHCHIKPRAECGQVAEWLKAADCKSARFSVRWFESSPVHHFSLLPFLQLWRWPGACFAFYERRHAVTGKGLRKLRKFTVLRVPGMRLGVAPWVQALRQLLRNGHHLISEKWVRWLFEKPAENCASSQSERQNARRDWLLGCSQSVTKNIQVQRAGLKQLFVPYLFQQIKRPTLLGDRPIPGQGFRLRLRW